MALDTYRRKRDFAQTSEPRGAKRRRKSGRSFVIQKHAARRLHYDFRLEMDGVLKSWAVTRGPSLLPTEKRLAVHVEDHPLEYGAFEGTIPKGEYGGGTVLLWDRGIWSPVGDPEKAYAKGHLEFELEGQKLRGRWHLVRMAQKLGEARENWLLIKGDDAYARGKRDPDVLEERTESVLTGRDMSDIVGESPGWSSKTGKIAKPKAASGARSMDKKVKARASRRVDPGRVKGAKKGALPEFVSPMLATLVPAPPAGKNWIHEIKFDGYRLQARLDAGRVTLLTRSALDWTKKFGRTVVSALERLSADTALLDGELVVETSAGSSDFSSLQADLSEGRSDRFTYYAFDLLHLDGLDLRSAPLVERKAILEKLLHGAAPALRYSEHFSEDGALILRHACRLSLEGVISKQRGAPYQSGRGKSWLKSKCSSRQEFVVGGYVPSTTSRKAIGSLALGVFDRGRLRYVGRVGTGFTVAVAEDLFKRCEKLRIDETPFAGRLTADELRGLHFIRPEMVAEVEFRAWTGDGHLRHASFRGLREDKDPKEIAREDDNAPPQATESRPRVRLTHPDRLYWPNDGVTKEGLADYYTQVWGRMAPFVAGRPLSLLRCPSGIEGERFFQKHAWRGAAKGMTLVTDPQNPKAEPLISIDSLDGLIGLAQSAALELHPWGATAADMERPDIVVMDLDPGEGVAWEAVIAAALEVRRRLEDVGLTPFVKTSGGKGLHVVAPLRPKATWADLKTATRAIAESMAVDDPDLYVATIAKAKRRGKILIDYLRNQRGATAVAPYSPRARAGAAVSMPLDWEEVLSGVGPDYFTILNAPARLEAQRRDPWADFRSAAAVLSSKRIRPSQTRRR